MEFTILGMPQVVNPVQSGQFDEVRSGIAAIEAGTGKRLGDAIDPLFLALYATGEACGGAVAASLLYVGLTEASLAWLSARTDPALAIAQQQIMLKASRRFDTSLWPSDPVSTAVLAVAAVCTQTGATEVTVTQMVLGNVGSDCGSGLAYSRDPRTGSTRLAGTFLPNGTGMELLDGKAGQIRLDDLRTGAPPWIERLRVAARLMEERLRDMCELEFVIEHGELWIVEARVSRHQPGSLVVAGELLSAGVLSPAAVLGRVTEDDLAEVQSAKRSPPRSGLVLAYGLGVSPGVASGIAVFDTGRAAELTRQAADVVLIRPEIRPEDLPGMLAARAIVAIRGGRTSHAAVVARSLGRPCITALSHVHIDLDGPHLYLDSGERLAEGDVVTVDGSAGLVLRGDSSGSDIKDDKAAPGVADAVQIVLAQADLARRLEVWANAETGEGALRARSLGAQGIGLCRTEHMFLGGRQALLERILLTPSGPELNDALTEMLAIQRRDFTDLLRAMDGLPVTIRLLDPPRHEFLPNLTDLSVRLALAHAQGHDVSTERRRLVSVERFAERNPMLGVRGARLGIATPEIYLNQIRAVAEATIDLRLGGYDPRPRLMFPMVASYREVERLRNDALQLISEVRRTTGMSLDIPIGSMIELPRAALEAGELTTCADFLSFGTNDLTQTVWGLSRDDTEQILLPRYSDLGVLEDSPFATLDENGVGQLLHRAVIDSRAVRPDMQIGVCGEHAADPRSIDFFHRVGLDYVSCPVPALPVVRLSAGRAASRALDQVEKV